MIVLKQTLSEDPQSDVAYVVDKMEEFALMLRSLLLLVVILVELLCVVLGITEVHDGGSLVDISNGSTRLPLSVRFMMEVKGLSLGLD